MLLNLLIVMVMEPGIPALVVTILVVTLPIFVRVARGLPWAQQAEYVTGRAGRQRDHPAHRFRHILHRI
ncbi:MAG: hypothetical protein R2855_03085 [Thermomicrobiales bacterium]